MKAMFTETRPLAHVPKGILYVLAISLLLQCLWHGTNLSIAASKTELASPPAANAVRLLSLDDKLTAAKLIMLWLQAFDTQPGISLSLKELNYSRVTEWLDLILLLDPNIEYPLLAAARFYAEVPVPDKQRQMIQFIQKKFMQAPNQRWPAMAHAVYIAKHRIKDLELAAACARLLRIHATAENVPNWARQMEFFVLEDMGELEAAKILIGGLLDSGELEDPQQQRFLSERFEEIERRVNERAMPNPSQ